MIKSCIILYAWIAWITNVLIIFYSIILYCIVLYSINYIVFYYCWNGFHANNYKCRFAYYRILWGILASWHSNSSTMLANLIPIPILLRFKVDSITCKKLNFLQEGKLFMLLLRWFNCFSRCQMTCRPGILVCVRVWMVLLYY